MLLTTLIILFRVYNTDNVATVITLVKLKSLPYYSSIYLATILLIICSSIKSVQIIGHL